MLAAPEMQVVAWRRPVQGMAALAAWMMTNSCSDSPFSTCAFLLRTFYFEYIASISPVARARVARDKLNWNSAAI
jgi:hypothetical protein